MSLPVCRWNPVARFNKPVRALRLRRAGSAAFSRCRIRHGTSSRATLEDAASPVIPKHEGEDKLRDDETPNTNRKSRGWSFPALGLFAVGLPLGWYLSTHPTGEQGTRVADPGQFVAYTLVGKHDVSSTSAVFRLRPRRNVAIDLDEPLLERAITSVEFKQPQLQIARSYTCLPQEDGQHMDELRFLIRREQKGEVSNFLHRLPVGSEIEVRGLHAECALPRDAKKVVFLAGGTGIAPALQTVDIIDGQANVHILWACRKREDCIGGSSDTTPSRSTWSWRSILGYAPVSADRKIGDMEKGTLVALMESLRKRSAYSIEQGRRLLVDYYVDEEGSFIKPEDVKQALTSVLTEPGSQRSGRNILFVSGPEGFISHWAGAKQWINGREVQGPLRGILSTMDVRDWDIIKL